MKKGERTTLQIETILEKMNFLPKQTKNILNVYIQYLKAKKEDETWDKDTFISELKKTGSFPQSVSKEISRVFPEISDPGVQELNNFYGFLTYVNEHKIKTRPEIMIKSMAIFLEKRVTITKSEIELIDYLSIQGEVSWKEIQKKGKRSIDMPQVRIRELISDLRRKALLGLVPVVDYNRFGLDSIVFLSRLVNKPYVIMPSHPYLDDSIVFPMQNYHERFAISSYQIPHEYYKEFIAKHEELMDETIQVLKTFRFHDIYMSMDLRYLRTRPVISPSSEMNLIQFQLQALKEDEKLEVPIKNLWEFQYYTPDRDFSSSRGERRINFREEELAIVENAYSDPLMDGRVFPPRKLISERTSTSVRRVILSLSRLREIEAVKWRLALGVPSLRKTTMTLIGDPKTVLRIGKGLMNVFPYSIVKVGQSLTDGDSIVKAEYYHDPLVPVTDKIRGNIHVFSEKIEYVLLKRERIRPQKGFIANYRYRGGRWLWDERSNLGFSIAL